MANKSSDHLHRLIHSMTKPEKRYFKLHTSKNMAGDSGNYQLLFDAIAKQDEYDEEKILSKFRKEAFAQRFPITKNRLYNVVLKSLDAFHSNSSADARLKRQIHYAEILYQKSLYDQALKILQGARKMAEDLEQWSTLLEISKWEKRMMERKNYEDVNEEMLDSIRKNDLYLLSKLDEFHLLWHAKSLVFNRMYKKGRARSAEEAAQFKNDLKCLGEGAERLASTVENTYLYHHLMSAYYYSLNDYKNSLPHLKSNLQSISDNLDFFAEEPDIYLSVLTNTIYVGMQMGEYDSSFKLLQEVRRMPERMAESMTEDLSIRIFATTGNLELALYIYSGNFDQGIKALPAIEEGLFKFEDRLSALRKAQFYFNIALVCFGAGRYNEALKWLNQLLNNIGIDQSLDIHCFAQLFFLIIHLELGNKSLLPYALRSTQRYLQTRERAYEFEHVFLEFINQSLHKRQHSDEKERFAELLVQLQELEKNPFERTAFEYFDLPSWARSKAEGKSFAECVKEAGERRRVSS